MRIYRLYAVLCCSFVAFACSLATTAAAYDITSNLKGEWLLTETSGTTASDSTSNNNDGTYTNGPTLSSSTAMPGSGAVAATFDGSNDYVAIPNESAFDFTSSFTVAAWIKVSSFSSAWQAIVTKGDSGWRLSRSNSTNFVHFAWGSSMTPKYVDGVTNVNDGKWHHVCGVYDGSTIKLYVDGQLEASASASGAVTTNNYAVQIGQNAEQSGRNWHGAIYDVRLYTRALAQADVEYLYSQGLPVAWWKLDETSGTSAADASGYTHTGTVTGTTSWTTGVIHNGFSFNGSTKIQATGLIDNPRNITVTAWANLTAPDSSGADVISLGDHFVLRLDAGTWSTVSVYNGSGWDVLWLNRTFATTGWHHFAAVFDDDNNSLKLYVDGVLAASSTVTNSLSYSGLGSNTVIGRHGNASTNYDFTGTIDDVRVYNFPLSASDVIEVYGLIGYWKLDETSGTSAADSSGKGYTGTVTGTVNWTSAVVNNGFKFNGASKIQITGLLNNPKSVSAAAWANLTTADSNGAEVITLGDHFVLRLDAGSGTDFLIYNGSTWPTLTLNKTFAGTGWHHFVAVFDDDNDTMKLYVDGTLAASGSTASSISYAGLGTDTRIGTHGVAQTTVDFTGTIDDVRVYNYPLSATAVAELYGLIGYWKLDESSGTTAADSSPMGRSGTVTGTSTWTSCIINNGFSFDGASKIQVTGLLNAPKNVSVAAWANLSTADSGGSEAVSLGDHFSLRLDDSSATKVYYYDGTSWNSLSVSQTVAGSGWHHFVAVFDDDNNLMKLYIDGELAGSTAAASSISYAGQGANTVIGQHGNGGTTRDFTGKIDEVRVYNRVLTNSEIVALHGLVGHWKLTETSGAAATDSTLNANNGTYLNGVSLGTSSNVPGYNVKAAVFDGTNDYVSTSSESTYDLTGSLSAAAWVKVSAFNKSWQAIMTKGDTSWRLARETTTNNVTFAVNGLTTYKVTTATSVNDGKWHHLVGVYDGSNLKIYVDGALNATASTSGTASTNNYAVYIGENAEITGRQFNGAIYDARVYNRAITAEEVSQLYGSGFAGVIITKWVELQ